MQNHRSQATLIRATARQRCVGGFHTMPHVLDRAFLAGLSDPFWGLVKCTQTRNSQPDLMPELVTIRFSLTGLDGFRAEGLRLQAFQDWE